jgi:hypothetical protein
MIETVWTWRKCPPNHHKRAMSGKPGSERKDDSSLLLCSNFKIVTIFMVSTVYSNIVSNVTVVSEIIFH